MFDFEVVYIPGSDNVVANAGTEHANTEFTQHDMLDNDTSTLSELGDSVPILAGLEAQMVMWRSSHVCHPTEKVAARQEVMLPRENHPIVVIPQQQKEGRDTTKDFTNDEGHTMEDVAKEKGMPSKSAREGAGDDSGPEERVVDGGSTVELPGDSEGLLLAHKSLRLDMRSKL